MFCERCKAKASNRRQVLITCRICRREEYVPLYNNNQCRTCNEKTGTCEECGRSIEAMNTRLAN